MMADLRTTGRTIGSYSRCQRKCTSSWNKNANDECYKHPSLCKRTHYCLMDSMKWWNEIAFRKFENDFSESQNKLSLNLPVFKRYHLQQRTNCHLVVRTYVTRKVCSGGCNVQTAHVVFHFVMACCCNSRRKPYRSLQNSACSIGLLILDDGIRTYRYVDQPFVVQFGCWMVTTISIKKRHTLPS